MPRLNCVGNVLGVRFVLARTEHLISRFSSVWSGMMSVRCISISRGRNVFGHRHVFAAIKLIRRKKVDGESWIVRSALRRGL